jgi:hypothetical protein
LTWTLNAPSYEPPTLGAREPGWTWTEKRITGARTYSSLDRSSNESIGGAICVGFGNEREGPWR